MTTVIYSGADLYADSQITSTTEFAQVNYYPKVKTITSVGLENKHHGKTKILFNGQYYVSYAGSMALIQRFLRHMVDSDDVFKVLEAVQNTVDDYEELRSQYPLDLSCRVLVLNKSVQTLYGFKIAALGGVSRAFGVDGSNE